MLSSHFYLFLGEAVWKSTSCLLPDVPLPSVAVPVCRMGAAGVGSGCWSCCCTQSPLAAPARTAGVPEAGGVPRACHIPMPLGCCSPSLQAGCVAVMAEAGRRLTGWVSAGMPGPAGMICEALLPCSSSKHPPFEAVSPLVWSGDGGTCAGLSFCSLRARKRSRSLS